jgi:hypothetical protein
MEMPVLRLKWLPAMRQQFFYFVVLVRWQASRKKEDKGQPR